MGNEIKAHTVNKRIYLVLTFFLGAFGIHKFYARRPFTGILIALLSLGAVLSFVSVFLIPLSIVLIIITVLWLIISFVRALFTKADDAGNIEA